MEQPPFRLKGVSGLVLFLSSLFLVYPAFGSTDFLVPPGRAAQPVNMIVGPDHNLWFAETAGEKIGHITTSGVITEFAIPGAQSLVGIAAGPDGNLWFTDQFTGKVGHISTSGNKVVQYSLPKGTYPQGITLGPDQNLWFVDQKQDGLFTIGTITTKGRITEYPTNINVGVFQPESLEYAQITTGPDGNLWFVNPQATNLGINLVGQITPKGAVTTFPLNEGGLAICSGPDGNLWVTEFTQIAVITTSGVESDYQVLNGTGFTGITTGPDGNVWFTEAPNSFGYVVPSTFLVVEFAAHSQFFSPSGITAGPDGAVWMLGNVDSVIGRISTQGKLTNTYALNHGSIPTWSTLGPDGAVWFTEDLERIGRITTNGVVTSFPTVPGSGVLGITAGPDGNVWFTEAGVGAIAKMTTSGVMTAYPVLYGLNGIAVGPDGDLWFPNSTTNTIGRITTNGIITDFPLPTPFAGAMYIAEGPDNALWFTETYASQVGRVDPTDGAITEYPVTPGSTPGAITTGPDGNLWYLEQTLSGGVAKMTTAGVVTEYSVPVATSLVEAVSGIVAGPDGAVWFPQYYPNSLARITPSGVVSTVPLSTLNAGGLALSVGADHKLWVGEGTSGRFGRLSAIGGAANSISAVHGNQFSGPVASFVDGTPTASQSNLQAMINWGDGTSSAGTVTGSLGGPFTVTGSHTYGGAGTFKLSVSLTDNVDRATYQSAPGKANVQ